MTRNQEYALFILMLLLFTGILIVFRVPPIHALWSGFLWGALSSGLLIWARE